MYSRKFGQNSIPPDYGGVSFRRDDKENTPAVPTPSQPPDCPEQYPPQYASHYPGEFYNQERPKRTMKVKRAKKQPTAPQESKKEERSSGLGALTGRSFTMEDIVLAGLILLLLNSDCDSELLLILGFLLLVGLQ